MSKNCIVVEAVPIKIVKYIFVENPIYVLTYKIRGIIKKRFISEFIFKEYTQKYAYKYRCYDDFNVYKIIDN